MSTFATSVHCMDGRIQQPIIEYLRRTYRVEYVDVITEASPLAVLTRGKDRKKIKGIFERIEISRTAHASRLLCISGHHDCAANPLDAAAQCEQVVQVARMLQERLFDMKIVGLYVDDQWQVRVA